MTRAGRNLAVLMSVKGKWTRTTEPFIGIALWCRQQYRGPVRFLKIPKANTPRLRTGHPLRRAHPLLISPAFLQEYSLPYGRLPVRSWYTMVYVGSPLWFRMQSAPAGQSPYPSIQATLFRARFEPGLPLLSDRDAHIRPKGALIRGPGGIFTSENKGPK